MQRKGFTLVEIMIVVAIIGILIAIAVPGFLRAREISRRNACQENQSKLDGAVQQYMLEWRIEDMTALLAGDNMPGAITAAQTDNGDDTWDADDTIQLVGEDSYIRFPPTCPSGGIYSLQEADPDADPPVFPVACDLSDRSANDVNEQFWHVYPGETAVVVAP